MFTWAGKIINLNWNDYFKKYFEFWVLRHTHTHTHMFNALLSVCVCMCVCLTTQMCSTLCSPMDCNSPGFSVHGISQTRILEWVAIFYFRRSSQPRNWTPVDSIGRWTLNHWAIWEVSFLFFGILMKTKKADGNLVH